MTIEALKLAREELHRVKAICLREVGIGLCNEVVLAKIDQAIAEAAKQEQGEPVAWMNSKRDMTYIHGPYNADDIPLYTTPQPKQEQGEPFGWYDMEHGEIRDVEWNRLKPTYEGVWRPLYTTPQQRTWVGLTKEDIVGLFPNAFLFNDCDYNTDKLVADVRRIEAKLKEKQ